MKRRIQQYLAIGVGQVFTLLILAKVMDGLQIQSLGGAIAFSIAFSLAEVAFWWLFIHFFSYLPSWLYPLASFLLAAGLLLLAVYLIPGIIIVNFQTGFWMSVILTAVSALQAGYFSLEIEEKFDRRIARKLVARHGHPVKSDTPGILFLEIDGLSEALFRRALETGRMPTLKRWYDERGYQIQGWETDLSSQTGAIQAGILLGSNENIPAYRWWDRTEKRMFRSGNFNDAAYVEEKLSDGKGLLADGGASRGNMFSGDATEAMFTISTLLQPKRRSAPGFYLYLLNPFSVTRLITRFLVGVLTEWWQALRQRLRNEKRRVNARNILYGFVRASVCQVLQEITSHVVISDVLRGLPAIYALYAGYDDVAHMAGMDSPDAFGVLEDIDRHFGRIAHAVEHAPRPYRIVILSDHGQSSGGAFENIYGVSLEGLVKSAMREDASVFASVSTAEAWDHINALLNETLPPDSPSARLLRTMLKSKEKSGLLAIGPERSLREAQKQAEGLEKARLVALASGSLGLIYFPEADRRLSYEEIQKRYPDLMLNLVQHPGIGFILVRSKQTGDIVMSRDGIYFLDNDTFEGKNPLAIYSKHVPHLLRRESGFSNCPDILLSTAYDPETKEQCGFENQASHHGGLGGMQRFPFIFHPRELAVGDEPLVGAEAVHRLLLRWREA